MGGSACLGAALKALAAVARSFLDRAALPYRAAWPGRSPSNLEPAGLIDLGPAPWNEFQKDRLVFRRTAWSYVAVPAPRDRDTPRAASVPGELPRTLGGVAGRSSSGVKRGCCIKTSAGVEVGFQARKLFDCATGRTFPSSRGSVIGADHAG
jgi:hypothetical protein